MRNIKKRLLYELQREPEEKKVSLQDLAGRLFIGFLIMMLLLTIVSRAAASVTVAKVDVTSPKKGALNFEVNGVGTLGAKAEKYLNLYEGVRIAGVFVNAGQNVDKGDLLFQYDINDLEEVLDSMEDEIVKAELNLQKERLNYKAEREGSAKEMAELSLERAVLDLKAAKEDLKIVKKNIGKEKKYAYVEAEKAYLNALEAYNDQEDNKQKAIKEADKKVTETKEVLGELNQDKDKTDAETVIVIFRASVESNNFEAIKEAETNIFKKYYGETEYEKHKKDVERARKALSRANEDYWNRIAELEEGEKLSPSEYARYKRAIEDAEDALADLTKKDNELTMAMWDYRNAIQYNKTDLEKTYSALYTMLYTEKKEKEKLINAANKAIVSAEESLAETTKEWEKLMGKAEKAVAEAETARDKAKALYNQILDKTYDYSQDVKTEEMQLITAKRKFEDAKLGIKEARKSDEEMAKNNNIKRQTQSIDLKLSEMEIKNKEEAAAELNGLLKNKGKVNSPITGVLVEFGVAIGNRITGAERICFALSNYGFEAKVSKDEVKHLAIGDEMILKVGDSKDEVSITLESMSSEDAEGKITITGIMPKGNYTVGTPASFKVSKQSKQYRNTIPIQALRMDANNKTYVLITEETNTILGNGLTALRMDVTVIEKDYTIAAIENGLSGNIIVSSNKIIKEGDRVRLNDHD